MSFIQANASKYTIKQLCSALKFPRSTYYAALNHVPSKRVITFSSWKEYAKNVIEKDISKWNEA